MTGRGLPVLAVASRPWTSDTAPSRDEAEAPGLELLGPVGLLNPPRTEAADTVAACHAIDGDHLDSLPNAQLAALLAGTSEITFSRATPEAKLRIANALHAQHQIVAMTGDGINDAPALHHANIGVHRFSSQAGRVGAGSFGGD